MWKRTPELLDLLAKRNTTFTAWCGDMGLTTWDAVLVKCKDIGVNAPDVSYASQVPVQFPASDAPSAPAAEYKAILDEAHDKAERSSSLPTRAVVTAGAVVLYGADEDKTADGTKVTKRMKSVKAKESVAWDSPGKEAPQFIEEENKD